MYLGTSDRQMFILLMHHICMQNQVGKRVVAICFKLNMSKNESIVHV